MGNVIRVVVVDDNPIYREGIAAILKRERKIKFIGQGDRAEDAFTLATRLGPDVLLLDAAVPGDAQTVLCEIRRHRPSVAVVMMSGGTQNPDVSAAIMAGARGYILKTITARDLVTTVVEVAAGETRVAPELTGRVLAEMKQLLSPQRDAAAQLTHREDATLQLVAAGLSNKEIGNRLGIAEKTVKNYMTSLMDKLNVRNRVEAALALRARRTFVDTPVARTAQSERG